ncbi:MAG: SDR family oxidoreductase [Ectothiorhodospiraceae bacterium]|nr:SDR family oxidoreductase [Ectothiorhodospiraceae bacterium]
MNIHFPGREVLVTGAARGIGRGIVHAFAARGATVHACDLLVDALDEVATSAACAEGGSVRCHAVDVGDAEAVTALVAQLEAGARAGALDVVVHCAGGVRGQHAQPIESVSPQAWREIQDANLTGLFNLARAVVPAMKRAGSGRIVAISSRAGLGVSLTGIQSYGAAKAGQIGLVRQLAHELGQFGITVNSVAPGFMRTSPDYERQWASYGEAGQRAMVERVAMRRLGQPEDIAHAVLFLASDYAQWITGQTLAVTGGP